METFSRLTQIFKLFLELLKLTRSLCFSLIIIFSILESNGQIIDDTTYADNQKVFDQYGNEFRLSDIAVPLNAPNSCDVGFFHIEFTDPAGGGFNDLSSVGTDLRNVVCQVFLDLSQLIVPVKQSATLFYKFDENKNGVLYLSNYLGQLVKTQELKANDNAITITTGSLADGIYHYKVISNGEAVGNGKLAVIK